MPFFQAPPRLGNQYEEDRVLRSHLARALPSEILSEVLPELADMGALAGGELFELQAEDRAAEPELVQWDAWGNRVDRIELTRVWRRAATLAAERGLVAIPYERRHGRHSRLHQFALVYLFDPSTDTYSCPLAMTDGAARTLVEHKNDALIARAVTRLTSRDPRLAWTSGQWMTERTGGSDVGLSETEARPAPDAALPQAHRLYGTKWFTSAATSDMALTLARTPEGGPGGSGLTLFYVETYDEAGNKNGVLVNRLKDKLGTRKLPTAELTLDGALATPVAGLQNGVRNITPMLNVTRTWNAVCSVAAMRRDIALATDYARRRSQFGARLSDKPLHLDTLAGLAAEHEAAFALAFRVVELLGAVESGEATADDSQLLRALTPIAKLVTAKQAVAVMSEVLECFGGAGYVEDTGIPRLYRDAQVLPIWEGTTNVLSLDLLRAIRKDGALDAIERELFHVTEAVREPRLGSLCDVARAALRTASGWLTAASQKSLLDTEAEARRVALTLGRALELALLARHASFELARGRDRAALAARRFAAHGIIAPPPVLDVAESARLVLG